MSLKKKTREIWFYCFTFNNSPERPKAIHPSIHHFIHPSCLDNTYFKFLQLTNCLQFRSLYQQNFVVKSKTKLFTYHKYVSLYFCFMVDKKKYVQLLCLMVERTTTFADRFLWHFYMLDHFYNPPLPSFPHILPLESKDRPVTPAA